MNRSMNLYTDYNISRSSTRTGIRLQMYGFTALSLGRSRVVCKGTPRENKTEGHSDVFHE